MIQDITKGTLHSFTEKGMFCPDLPTKLNWACESLQAVDQDPCMYLHTFLNLISIATLEPKIRWVLFF